MLPETKIIRGFHLQTDTRWNYKNACYPYNSLYFIAGGDGHIKLGDTVTDLVEGNVYLIPANISFAVWCDTHIDKYFSDVTSQIVPGYDIFSDTKEVLSTVYSKENLELLIQKSKIKNVKNEMFIQGEIEKVLSNFLPASYDFDVSLVQFKPMLEYIEKHISSRLQVGEIAKLHHYNTSVLSRKFKHIFGITLKAYIENLLIVKLQQEMLLTSKTLKEIALLYGFCDQYYMSGFFKKFTGISPSEYRKSQDFIHK